MPDKKLWSGRFTDKTHPLVESFNASISFDKRLYRHDISGSIAHAEMLGHCKIIKKTEADKIVKGLKKIEKEISSGKIEFTDADEDIHMGIERRLMDIIGEQTGGKLHTGRSRNDQVATSFRMFVRDELDEVVQLIRELQRALHSKAGEHVDTIAPAYTHLQPAQPVRLAHWFLAYFEMMERDVDRLIDSRKRINVLPLGSAALAGTNFPIDRKRVAKQLGFGSVSENSIDAVSDRDFVAEFLFAISLITTHLSRLAEELIIFSSNEFGVMELPDAFCTGSSIMPQKKNPDVPELIRGKTGRIYGHLISVLTTLKALPLAYNKDMQEDKEPLFDSADQIKVMLELSAQIITALKVDKEKLSVRAEQGFMTAVDVADGLVIKGMPFREAHGVVGQLVRYCLDKKIGFNSLTKLEADKIDPGLYKVLAGCQTASKSTDGKKSYGGTARKRIVSRLGQLEKRITQW